MSKREHGDDEDMGEEQQQQQQEGEQGEKKGPPSKKNKNNEVFWELSDKRRVTLTKFGRGKDFKIDVREFYEKDGEQLPGKKGLMLTYEQYRMLVDLEPQIRAACEK